jgi:spore coat protein U-like protein
MARAAAAPRLATAAAPVLACAFTLACASLAAQAETATATLTIRVTIPPVTVIRMPTRHVEFDLSAADVARGFVTPAAPLQVEVTTNLGGGLQLAVACISAPCEMKGASISPSAGQVPPGRGMRQHALSVPLQLPIARDAQPGTYRVAVQVTALGH